MDHYSIAIAWCDRDEGFVARVPEFPDLYAFGATREEALAEAQVALEGYIEIYEEDGMPLPEPVTRRAYSGQVRLRLPRALHEQLTVQAAYDGVSLNSYMETRLASACTQQVILREVQREVRRAIAAVPVVAFGVHEMQPRLDAGITGSPELRGPAQLLSLPPEPPEQIQWLGSVMH
jgi:antitoxin HicB